MLTKKRSRLAGKILGLIGIAGIISIFFYGFLEFATRAVVETYCEKSNVVLNDIQWEYMQYWLQRVSLLTSVVMFLLLCLFLTGQKLIYIRQIIQGVEALRERDMDFEVPVEGDDELAQLAESINYLAKSQRKLKEKEEALRQEKDVFIRSLSHDIRTPLTSVLAMSEYLDEKDQLSEEEMKSYISLVKNKSAQMKILTDRLLNEGRRNLVFIKNGKLLFEQLIEEWQELLEEEFDCKVNIENCEEFQGEFDVAELRRIFDNLASNVQKYADAEKAVELEIFTENSFVIMKQMNGIAGKRQGNMESYGIGLQSIERLTRIYQGTMEVQGDQNKFLIVLKLKIQNSDEGGMDKFITSELFRNTYQNYSEKYHMISSTKKYKIIIKMEDKHMMTSLDALVITFLVLSGLSLLGLLIMFLGRKENTKKIGFYYTVLAAIGLTTINVIFHPPLHTAGYLLVIGFGILAVAAFVLHIRKKTPEMRKIARILAAVSMMAAVADLAMV